MQASFFVRLPITCPKHGPHHRAQVQTDPKPEISLLSYASAVSASMPQTDEWHGHKGEGLLRFLSAVEDDVVTQLKRNVQSHAFDGYVVQWEAADTDVICTHTLQQAELNGQLQVRLVLCPAEPSGANQPGFRVAGHCDRVEQRGVGGGRSVRPVRPRCVVHSKGHAVLVEPGQAIDRPRQGRHCCRSVGFTRSNRLPPRGTRACRWRHF
jgi:hypothetical protein